MRPSLTGFDHLRDACAEVGLVFDRLDPALLERLQVLASTTETVRDVEHIVKYASAFFAHYEAHRPEQRFTESEKRVVVIGSLFSDIGKTGPLHADPSEQRMIAEMFAIEGVRDDQQPVAQLLRTSFPRDADVRIARFARLGIDPQMSMRAFWNLHAAWTLQIVRKGGVPDEAVAAAATHHLLENVNPEAIVRQDGRYAVDFGDNVAFDRAEKLVILLDKYDAMRRRTGGDHAQAIAWLRKRLGDNPVFRSDPEFITLLEDLDVVAARR